MQDVSGPNIEASMPRNVIGVTQLDLDFGGMVARGGIEPPTRGFSA